MQGAALIERISAAGVKRRRNCWPGARLGAALVERVLTARVKF